MKFGKTLNLVVFTGALAISQNGLAQSQQIYDTYYDKCDSAVSQADWKAATTFCDAAEKEAFKFGNFSYQVGDISDVMGRALKSLGKYKDAEAYLLQALSIRESNANRFKNGPETVASTQNNLASLYSKIGKNKEAEDMYSKSLAIYEKAYGKDSKQAALVLSNQAGVIRDLGRPDDAEALYLKAINIQQRKDPQSLALSNSYENIGNLYADKGKLAEASAYLIKSLELREKIFPENHPVIGSNLNNLGDLSLQMEGYSEALSFFEDSLKIRKESLPPDHPDIGQSLVNIGRAYYGLGRYKEAEQYLRDGLKRREISHGKKSGPVAFTLDCLAKALRAQKRDKEAVALEKRAATIRSGA